MAPTDMATLWSLVMGSMLAMAATPRPASPTSCADTPSSSSSAVGSCRVPSLFFSFTTWIRAVYCLRESAKEGLYDFFLLKVHEIRIY